MIGKKIKARREELGLTQEQLATRLGYKSKSTINKIEMNKNDVTTSNIQRFADALEIDVMELMDESDTPDRLKAYALLLSQLPDEKLQQALDYITFLSNKEE